MGHRKKNTPHRGSLGYRRNKAKRHTARIRTWPESLEPKLLGFAGYKAGMTHIAMINTDTRSPFYKQEQFVPVTIVETPPLTVFSIRTYKTENLSNSLAVNNEIWTDKPDKDLSRRIKIPKEKSNLKQQIVLAKASINDVTEVRVLAHTKPREAGLPQKSPDILEIKVDTPKRKYHKRLDLPCDVQPKTTKATYKNGILDVVIKRKEKKKPGDGYKVNID